MTSVANQAMVVDLVTRPADATGPPHTEAATAPPRTSAANSPVEDDAYDRQCWICLSDVAADGKLESEASGASGDEKNSTASCLLFFCLAETPPHFHCQCAGHMERS
eukprot:gene16163-22324_t